MNSAGDFQPDIAALLAPIAGDLPAGPSMRYDPQYAAIRTSREEEDASLPMREWVRPLKKADWRVVADLSCTILRTRSKDFQVAGWLCEAWIHLHCVAGFNAAVELLTGLVTQYWDTAHPQIEDDDDEARVAPLFWMNENLPHLLMLHVPLINLPERMPSAVSTFDWDQALVLENRKVDSKKAAAPKASKSSSASPIPTRAEIVAGANGANLQSLITIRNQVQQGTLLWEQFTRELDAKMGKQAPSVAKVLEMLKRMERVCDTLIDGRDPKPVVVVPEPPPPPVEVPVPVAVVASAAPAVATSATDPTPPTTLAESNHAMGPINSREDAYRMLEAVALYLQKTEPHSPTPYLVQRAVTWGRMSLADLMQEIVREEGDLTRYFSLLGIREPRE